MQKKTFIIANWKMNMSVNDANKFIKKLDKLNYKKKKSSEIVICAQFLLLPSLSKISREKHNIRQSRLSSRASGCIYRRFKHRFD